MVVVVVLMLVVLKAVVDSESIHLQLRRRKVRQHSNFPSPCHTSYRSLLFAN